MGGIHKGINGGILAEGHEQGESVGSIKGGRVGQQGSSIGGTSAGGRDGGGASRGGQKQGASISWVSTGGHQHW
jgi:hypothetical protein